MFLRAKLDEAKSLYESHQKAVDVGVFLFGFFFDLLTVGSVDDISHLIQQSLYLVILGALLILELRQQVFKVTYDGRWEKIWKYKNLIFHFLLGSLLSLYTIFFFKSASLVASFVFIFIIVALLILNEVPLIQNLGTTLRTVLYSLCLGSFFAIYLPLLFGFVSWLPFLLAMILGASISYLSFVLLKRNKEAEQQEQLKKSFLLPAIITYIMYLNVYGLGLVPPVPLSLKHIGIYHKVAKDGDDYVLSYHRPFWKIWQSGAQTFLYRQGDELICFVSVFSPTGIQEQIYLSWYYDDPKQGWTRWDKIPLRISGGREGGYRGYGLKKNFIPGSWIVYVTTQDDREIGRISFEVVPDTDAKPVDYEVDRF